MEKILEVLLMLFWDAVKTAILQWLLERLKEWGQELFASRKMAFV